MPVRPRFDPKRALIAARGFSFLGRAYAPGDPFPHPEDAASIAPRLLARQYEGHAVNFAPEAPADPIQMTGPAGGRYTITAPWLERPLVIRGKVNAEKALADIREEGPPLGFIEGGTEVDIEEAGGDWYAISAPWMAEPEKVQGREAAEARQREIHDAGAPADIQAEDDAGDDQTASPASDAPDENAAKADTDAADIQAQGASADADDAVGTQRGPAGNAEEASEGGAGASEEPPASA